jgi:hypothetical protein
MGVNARMIEAFELDQLLVRHVDGAASENAKSATPGSMSKSG